MSNRTAQISEHFDLLPFISIMLCVLGCLLLITLSMAALSLGSAGEEWRQPCPAVGDADSQKVNSRSPILLIWDGSKVLTKLDIGSICVTYPQDQPAVECPNHYRKGSLDEIVRYLRETRDKNFAFFAIRPSGFEGFPRLRFEFDRDNINVGFEPIGQKKDVRMGTCRRGQ
jgi:hypothetical protein